MSSSGVVHCRLIGRNHVLDVDEGILTALLLEEIQGVLDQIPQAGVMLLPIVNVVSQVDILVLVKV